MNRQRIVYEPDSVSPPGATLHQIMIQRSLNVTDLAARLDLTRKHLTDILKGAAPITPETALKLERVLQTPARFWNNREQQYRDFLARKAEEDILQSQLEWLKNFKPFLNKMVEYGWIPPSSDPVERLRNLLNFFGVASPDVWEREWGELPAYFRKSQKLDADRYALAAWMRHGERVARTRACKSYDRRKFLSVLREVRELSRKPARVFQPQLESLCAECGVAVIFVPELPKTASGATRWLSPDRALLQLSLRYKTDDHLWFTFFHEAAHILLHQKKAIFVESKSYHTREENEADEFAATTLIPKRNFKTLIAKGVPTLAEVCRFADSLKIAPGIVVGQLQNRGIYAYNRGNRLKRTLKWKS